MILGPSRSSGSSPPGSTPFTSYVSTRTIPPFFLLSFPFPLPSRLRTHNPQLPLPPPQSRTQMARTIAAAEERRRADTGYDGPPSDNTNASALARISAWSSAAGMQAFSPEEGADTTLMLGGEVLVLDVTLAASTSAAAEPTVRMSYA